MSEVNQSSCQVCQPQIYAAVMGQHNKGQSQPHAAVQEPVPVLADQTQTVEVESVVNSPQPINDIPLATMESQSSLTKHKSCVGLP